MEGYWACYEKNVQHMQMNRPEISEGRSKATGNLHLTHNLYNNTYIHMEHLHFTTMK